MCVCVDNNTTTAMNAEGRVRTYPPSSSSLPVARITHNTQRIHTHTLTLEEEEDVQGGKGGRGFVTSRLHVVGLWPV